VFDLYMRRGDEPNLRQGTDLLNEVGTAMHFEPNNLPESDADNAEVVAGRWPFFKDKTEHAVRSLVSAIVKAGDGAEPVSYTILPIVHRNKKGAATSLPLFRVHTKSGAVTFVDNQGRAYPSLEAWRQENRLPEGTITFPKDGRLARGPDGAPALDTTQARTVLGSTALAYAPDGLDKVAMVGGLMVGAAAFVGVGGILLPISSAAMSVYYASRSLYKLHDRATHGKSAFDAEARRDWFTSVTSAVSLGASAVTASVVQSVAATGHVPAALAAIAPPLVVGSRTLGAVRGGKMAVDTAQAWDTLSPKQRLIAIAQIGFFSAGMGRQVTAADGLASLFSLDEVRYQLGIEPRPQEAATNGAPSWVTGAPESQGHKLINHNVFGERDPDQTPPTTAELLKREAKLNTLERWLHDGSLFIDGTKARIMGALFVNFDHRTDGDFRYAYGRDAWKGFERAEQRLAEIPRGELANALTLDLLKEVNALAYVPADDQGWPQVAHLMHQAEGRPVVPGELREDYQSRSLPWEMKPNQIANVKELGLEVSTVHVGPPGQLAVVYPEGEKVRANVEAIFEKTREMLRDPKADPVDTAAYFMRHLVAQHPNMDGNGRTERHLMNRILAERGLPPPILGNLDNDIALSQEEFADQIRIGIARTMDQTSSSLGRMDSSSSDAEFVQTVRIGGEQFVQDSVGFLRDVAGRAYLIDDHGELKPLNQLLSYLVERRMSQGGLELTGELTAHTRAQFAAWKDQPELAATAKVSNDQALFEGDNALRVELPDGDHRRFTRLFDLAGVPDEKLFGSPPAALFEGPPTDADRVSWIVSKYKQLDLEMWHMMKGLEHGGDHLGVEEMMRHRQHLFERAKGELEGLEPEQPYQQMALDRSPLRHSSLREAIQKDGDDTLTVWRGALPLSRLGMYNDNNPLNADARALAELRQGAHSVGHLERDLIHVEGNTLGTGYLSTSSDLGLYRYRGSFGDVVSAAQIELSKLPASVRSAIETHLPEGRIEIDRLRDLLGIAVGREPIPKGSLDISGISLERFSEVIHSHFPKNPEKAQTFVDAFQARLDEAAIRSWPERLQAWLLDGPISFRPPHRLPDEVTHDLEAGHLFATLNRKGDMLEVELQRRLYEVELPKKDALPGLHTIEGMFLPEQEVTDVSRIYPWQIRRVYTRADLVSE
jgi:hypothetical protein